MVKAILTRKYYLEKDLSKQVSQCSCNNIGNLLHSSKPKQLFNIDLDIDLNKGDYIIYGDYKYLISSKAVEITSKYSTEGYKKDIVYFVEKNYIIPIEEYDKVKDKLYNSDSYLAYFQQYEQ